MLFVLSFFMSKNKNTGRLPYSSACITRRRKGIYLGMGQRHARYLKQYRKVHYYNLLTSGNGLNE